ncbi:MAG: M43 family zinc metalloprotease [Chitinophagales bacterium]|nr:M43 family zinc metalloprotease [Chitinophagales bacterium]MDW8419709.1 M43 family zinc metalloprotease [Chitinophagales bacterium]
MKKLFIFSLMIAANNHLINAQSYCGADAARKELIRSHPEILIDEEQLEEFTRQYIQNNYKDQRSGPFIIPVVFHIIHLGGNENISKDQVLDAVRIMNEDFNKRNSDTSLVIPEFKNLIADMKVEFRLAQKDPWGNCTDGIERIYSSQTWMGNDYSKLNSWPREKYLNIWVVGRMRDGVAGYAYYPGSVNALYNVPARDGVMILHDYVGSIGTGNPGRSRALTHEIGHWSNLKHPWGDNNNPGESCGDDDVDDTPITKGWTFCPSANNSAVCTSGVKENYQNYMDYSYCSRMFTLKQKDRVHAALLSNKSQRNNLYTEANLIATGTNNGFTQTCAPIADFCVSNYSHFACVGNPVKFVNTSYNGPIDSVLWEFPNGTPAVSTASSPAVVFNTPGWQEVKLTVSNSFGSNTKVNNRRIFIAPNQPFTTPYYEDFEIPGVLNDYGWVSVNYDQNETYFTQVDFVGKSGTRCMMLNNYYTRFDRDIDELISPPFDLTPLSNQQLTLSFYYSLGSWDEDFMFVYDSLVVYATANCGGTWTKIYNKGGASIINAGYQQGFYVPGTDQAYWRFVKINIPPSLKQPNVRFKIQVFSSIKTNNFYIDDINIGSAPVGVEEDALSHFQVTPNPFGSVLLLHNLPSGICSVEMRDITGRLVLSEEISPAEDTYELKTSSLSGTGLYLLTIRSGNSVRTVKVMRQ